MIEKSSAIVWDPKDAPAVRALGGSIQEAVSAAREADIAAAGGLEWAAAVLGDPQGSPCAERILRQFHFESGPGAREVPDYARRKRSHLPSFADGAL